MRNRLQVAAVVLTGLAMVPAVAHALEWPGKKRLARDQYLAVQPIYYPGFTIAGAAEPLAILTLAGSLAATRRDRPAFSRTAAALAAAASTQLIYWIATAPANKVWLKDRELAGSAKLFFGAGRDADAAEPWTKLRDRWEQSHLWRAATATGAFLFATWALAAETASGRISRD